MFYCGTRASGVQLILTPDGIVYGAVDYTWNTGEILSDPENLGLDDDSPEEHLEPLLKPWI